MTTRRDTFRLAAGLPLAGALSALTDTEASGAPQAPAPQVRSMYLVGTREDGLMFSFEIDPLDGSLAAGLIRDGEYGALPLDRTPAVEQVERAIGALAAEITAR